MEWHFKRTTYRIALPTKCYQSHDGLNLNVKIHGFIHYCSIKTTFLKLCTKQQWPSNSRISIGVCFSNERGNNGMMDAIHDTCLFLYVSWHQKGEQEFNVPKPVYTICTLCTAR